MEYPTYPNILMENISWLGKTPSHWKIKRLRFVIRTNPVKSEVSSCDKDQLVSFVPMEAITENGEMGLEIEKPMSDVYSGYTFFKNNDVVLAKITPCFENGKGAIAKNLTNGIGFGTTEFHVLRALEETYPCWLYYLTVSYPFRAIGTSEMFGAGGQKRIPETFIKDFRIGVPSLDEQIKIANFLDHKTVQIDSLIEKKKALIEKLNEKRIALITQAVTKGLNPDAPMKPSGVAWLGDVPAHWDIRKLKFCIDIKGGGTPATGVKEYWDGDIPWVSPKDMKAEYISTTQDYITELGLYESATNSFDTGAVLLVVRSGILRHSIPVAINVVPVTINQDMKACIPYSHVLLNEYLMALIYGLQKSFLPIWSKPGCTVESIELEYMMNTPIPLPPIEEQNAIFFKINEEKKQIDAMLQATNQTINRLTEYRTALITAAVTGKIDVRGFEIPDSEAA